MLSQKACLIRAYFLAHFPETGGCHILTRIDATLRHLPGFQLGINAPTGKYLVILIDQHDADTGPVGALAQSLVPASIIRAPLQPVKDADPRIKSIARASWKSILD